MSRSTTLIAAVLGAVAYLAGGVVQVTAADFGGTHNTIDSDGELFVTAALAVSLLLVAPLYLLLGRVASAPRAAAATATAQVVLGAMSAVSAIDGEDAVFFNAVAPLCLLTWLGASVVLARALRRNAPEFPKPLALALPAVVPVTFALSPLGGPVLTAAFLLVVAARLHVPSRGWTSSSPISGT